ncbi:AmmeMemoRadiSam system protein B [Candidatus Woesearchaeota archaeon CG10_big_fil_rev_8_21_14_0_10_34_12]|nr:MAG: AmmeMemoRadiSam system protein B [Candidatus Woesearchaeota archaeon CG10_big_fil_rev_8_21_14_0_10_34_12]
MMKPQFAGRFYPKSEKELKEKINSFNKSGKKEKVKGIIVPHAGYDFSGNTANLVYSSVKQEFETVVIVGTDHTGVGNCVSLEDFETPLGVLKNETEISAEISGFLKKNNFEKEHSLEVQLPFIQAYFKDVKIVQIIIASGDYKELGKKIFQIIKKSGKKVLVVASSDFTHFGHYYSFVPKINIREIDQKVIDKILKFDISGFLEEARKTTVCGTGAIAVCMEICKLMKATKPEILSYVTSADISGDTQNIVSYAGIVFS